MSSSSKACLNLLFREHANAQFIIQRVPVCDKPGIQEGARKYTCTILEILWLDNDTSSTIPPPPQPSSLAETTEIGEFFTPLQLPQLALKQPCIDCGDSDRRGGDSRSVGYEVFRSILFQKHFIHPHNPQLSLAISFIIATISLLLD